MLTGSPAYILALPLPHHRVSRFTVRTPDGTLLADDVPIGGGQVTAQIGSRVTRTATFTADDSWLPVNETDPLSPAHAIVTIRAGIAYPSGEEELFPIFTGRVYEARRARNGQVNFRADDLAAEVLAADFEKPMNSQPGGSCVAEIQRLVSDAWPYAVYGVDQVTDAAVPKLTWDDDRGKACDDLATVVGGRWYTLGDGSFVVRQFGYTDTTPVVTLRDGNEGDGGTLTSADTVITADGAYNSVVVTTERADGGNPIRVVERNENALSPFRYGGPFGKRVLKTRSQTSVSVSEAQRVARSQLAASAALTRQWSVECVPDMRLEPADVFNVRWRGVRDVQVIDSITYPLSPRTAMQINGRSSITSDSVT
jgi:Domain of unknown function (DUF5047)